jgi:hypothetical protein
MAIAIGKQQPSADMGTIEQTATHPWCVVIAPGTDAEYVEGTQHRHYPQAVEWVRQARAARIHADVAKRLLDGSITYEF